MYLSIHHWRLMSRQPIDPCLRYLIEHEGGYDPDVGYCDWGFCDRPQSGWAVAVGETEWLPICHACSRGDQRTEPNIPVDRYLDFADIHELMGNLR